MRQLLKAFTFYPMRAIVDEARELCVETYYTVLTSLYKGTDNGELVLPVVGPYILDLGLGLHWLSFSFDFLFSVSFFDLTCHHVQKLGKID